MDYGRWNEWDGIWFVNWSGVHKQKQDCETRWLHKRLINEKCDEIQNLSKQINCNNLAYYYESKDSSPKSFNGFTFLLNVRKKQKNLKFKSNLNSIARAKINNKSKKVHYEILKCFTNYEKKLSNYQKLSKGYQKLLNVIHNLFNFNRKEVTRIEKNGKKIRKNIFYRLQFIDSARFMARSLSNLVNNLAEGIHNIKCKYGQDDKKCRTCRNKYNYCDCFLEYANFNDDLIEHKCLCC